MRGRGFSAAFAVALSALPLLTTGCTRESERAPGAATPAGSAATSSGDKAPRPVSLPDLSQAAPSVQEQIRAVHSALMRQIEQPGTPATDLANAYGEMGKLFMAAEFGNAAESSLLNAQMLAPGDMRWPYYLGHLYKEQGANDKSMASFEQALRLRPDDVATLIWLGEAHLAQDRPDAAEPHFTKARSLQPRAAAALAGLGRVFLAKRDYAGAAKYLEEVLALNPQAGIVHYSLAMAYRGLGDLAKAEAHLRQRGKGEVLVPDPLMQEVRGMLKSAASYESLGISALERGDSAAAAAYFRRGIEVAPDSASLHHRLGTALFLGGDARAGQAQFEAALRISPDFARAHYSLGVLMASTGRYQQAIERLSAAVKSDPDYVEATLLLADLLRHSGRLDESLRRYGDVIRIDPRLAEGRLGHALALAAMGRYPQARDRLIEATNAHPDQPDLLQALARLLAAAPDPRVRDGARAVALMETVVKQQRTPELDETMAMAYAETGDFQQAVAWQRQAIAAAERIGRDPHVRRQMTENLRLFERREPCRVPWREGTMP
jgi:tetratricopeptide (TPR) repeat protein